MSSVIIRIAKNEFSRCIGNPIVILASIFLCFSSLIVVAGEYNYIYQFQAGPIDNNETFLFEINQTSFFISLILSFLSLCIGIVALAGERSNGSMRVLLTKPLYRRDILVGKFVGIGALLLVISIFIMAMCIGFSLIAFGIPSAFFDDIIRTITLTALLLMLCLMFTSITLLCGVLFKDLYMSLILATSFYIMVWLMSWPQSLAGILNFIDPVIIYRHLIGNYHDLNISYSSWVLGIFPTAVYMLLAILVIFFIGCYVFTREEI